MLTSIKPADSSHGPAANTVGTGGQPAIILVDDDEWLRRMAAQILRSRGYGVKECPSATEALDYLREHGDEIRLVLSDVVLPGLNGYSLADHLRRDRPDLAVLLMSGRLPALLPEGDAGMGFGRILEKPFTPEGLLRAVEERLTGQAAV